MSNILFSDNDKGSNNQNEHQELSAEESLKVLVGADAKYATVEDMAKAMLHSQNHITKLETEATTLREAAVKQTSIDDILAALKTDTGEQQHASDDNLNLADQQSKGSEQVDIAKTVQDALAAQLANQTAQSNSVLVRDTLQKALGDRAAETYAKVGKTLGVDLDKLSEQSPEAVIKLVVGQQPANQQQQNLPRGTVQQSPTDISGELTQSKINAMYKAGDLNRDQKFRLEHAQAQKLGRAFFN